MLRLLGALAIMVTLLPADWEDLSDNIPDPDAELAGVHFVGGRGWVCSSTPPGRIFHTTDAGMTFTTQAVDHACRAVFMLDSSHGYACGAGGRVFRTTDAGEDWALHGTIGAEARALHFTPGSDTGWCCGDSGRVARITPSAVEPLPTGTGADLHSVIFPDSAGEGWACGEDIILHYADGLWHDDQSCPPGTYRAVCHAWWFGWAFGDSGLMVRSARSDTWTEMTNPDSLLRDQSGAAFLEGTYGWVVGDAGLILLTIDGGRWWRIRAPGLTDADLLAVHAVDTGAVYVVGKQGTFLRYSGGGGVSETRSDDRRGPLSQSTICRGVLVLTSDFSVLTSDFALLNISGQRVLDLQPGENDIRHVSPGIYFIREESARATRKVVVTR